MSTINFSYWHTLVFSSSIILTECWNKSMHFARKISHYILNYFLNIIVVTVIKKAKLTVYTTTTPFMPSDPFSSLHALRLKKRLSRGGVKEWAEVTTTTTRDRARKRNKRLTPRRSSESCPRRAHSNPIGCSLSRGWKRWVIYAIGGNQQNQPASMTRDLSLVRARRISRRCSWNIDRCV